MSNPAFKYNIKIDPEAFFQDVKMGMTLTDLKLKYDIKSPSRVYTTYVAVLTNLGLAPPLGGGPGRKSNATKIKKRKSGAIIIPNDVVKKMGEAHEYQIQITSKGIILKPLDLDNTDQPLNAD